MYHGHVPANYMYIYVIYQKVEQQQNLRDTYLYMHMHKMSKTKYAIQLVQIFIQAPKHTCRCTISRSKKLRIGTTEIINEIITEVYNE